MDPWPFGAWSGAMQDAHYSGRRYAAEAALLTDLLEQIAPHAETLLDVACGTGQHLQRFATRYQVEGVDLDERVLEDAAARLPGVALHREDMASFQLGRQFDVITSLFHVSGYLMTQERLEASMLTLARHTRADGVVILEPWLTPASFRDGELAHGVHDDTDLKVSWMYIQRREGDRSIYDIDFQVGSKEAGIVRFERHEELALFSVEQYLQAFGAAAFQVHHLPRDPWGYGLYVARKGAAWSSAEVATIERMLAA